MVMRDSQDICLQRQLQRCNRTKCAFLETAVWCDGWDGNDYEHLSHCPHTTKPWIRRRPDWHVVEHSALCSYIQWTNEPSALYQAQHHQTSWRAHILSTQHPQSVWRRILTITFVEITACGNSEKLKLVISTKNGAFRDLLCDGLLSLQ